MSARPPAPRSLPAWLSPVWLVLGAIVSVQVGAAFAKSLFALTDPTAVAWLRMAAAAAIFWVFARPRLRGRTWPEWRVVIGYGIALATMNWAIYQSFARIPIGLAVTIEFLGPLAVALVGSRRARDLVWVGLAAVGVTLLGVFPTTVDWAGIGFALLAGAAWAAYIVLSGPTGAAWEGVTGVSVGSLVGALVFLVPGLVAGGSSLWQPRVAVLAVVVGVLSSVIPYGLEMVARRRIPAGVFGILMSLEPAAAALAALLVLGEQLGWVELVAMACVIVASVGSTRALAKAPAPN
ncbi:Threonine/homoserine exporter RhtA [Propionicimonas sp. T2.31MG-18]|uniref:EamA family transporter n=1 Tax=Propionicimonas sp. T2.31MG-18 TaxID=3157620 RepID=UPI0035E86450